MKDKSCLEDLKKRYGEVQKKFGLPSFEELNKDFQIEKIAEGETDFLIREVRKMIGDKLSNYLRFMETLLHPVNAPVFAFSMIKSAGEDDKKVLTEIYKKLAKIELAFIEADVEFSEEREVEFIKTSYNVWKKIQKDLLEFVGKVKADWNKELKIGDNGKNYFG